jgi:hypothetical protein
MEELSRPPSSKPGKARLRMSLPLRLLFWREPRPTVMPPTANMLVDLEMPDRFSLLTTNIEITRKITRTGLK